jgi:hypothetical protein
MLDTAATFEIIEAHLRWKGHHPRLTRGDEIVIACRGVSIRANPGSGISAAAEHADGLVTVIAALSDLEIEIESRRVILDQVRHALAWHEPPTKKRGAITWSDACSGPDCFDCSSVLELAEVCDLSCL